VPVTKLSQWFEVARRTTYYKPTRSPAKVKRELAKVIKEMAGRGSGVIFVALG